MIETQSLKDYLWNSICDAFETTIMMPVERLAEEEGVQYDGLLLAGSITFTGDVKGCVTILCSVGCAKNITRSMLMMEDNEEVEESELKDAIGEVCNLVVGGLKTRMLDDCTEMNISIPVVTKGRNLRPSLGLGTQRFSLFLDGKGYMFEFVMAYK